MIIRELELENFRCFKNQHFVFPEGVIGILGPNGSGKSSILEAISWALYGSTVLRTNREDLRLDSVSDSATCRVRMNFELDGEVFELQRQMTGRSLSTSAYLKSAEGTVVESFQGVTQYVEEKLLRMKESSFFRSVFSRQNEVRELSRVGPEERRQLFAKLLNVDRIKQARRAVDARARDKRNQAETMESQLRDLEELRSELKEKSSEQAQLENKVSKLEEKLKVITTKIKRKDKQFEDLNQKKDELNELEKKKESLKAKISGLKGNIEDRKAELQELTNKKKRMKKLQDTADLYEDLKKRRDKLEEEREKFQRRQQLESQCELVEDDLQEEKDKLTDQQAKLQQYGEVPEEIKKKKEEKKRIDKKIVRLEKQVATIDGSINKYSEQIEELVEKQGNIEQVGEDGKCPVCARPLGEDYGEVIDHFQSEIEEAEETVEKLEEKKGDIEKELANLSERSKRLQKTVGDLEEKEGRRKSHENAVEDLKKRIHDLKGQRKKLQDKLEAFGEIDYNQEEYNQTKKKLEDLEEDYKKFSKLLNESERIPDVEDKLKRFEDDLQQVQSDLHDLQEKIDRFDFDQDKFEQIKFDLKNLREEKDLLQDRYRKENTALAELKNEVEHLKRHVAREEKKRDDLKKVRERKYLLDRVSTYFDLFREDLLNRVRPLIAQRASNLLGLTTDGRYGKMIVDGDYQVKIYEDGTPYQLDRFSGGETDLANLCLRVAISELVVRRSGRQINFIVLDEIFGSQDEQRRRNILQALRNLDELFAQIFLITHAEEVKDRMENVILLSRDSHKATTVQNLM